MYQRFHCAAFSVFLVAFLALFLAACAPSVDPYSDAPDLEGEVQWVQVGEDGSFSVLVAAPTAGKNNVSSMIYIGSRTSPVMLQEDGRTSRILADGIREGDTVQGWFGPFVMDSLPPQTSSRRLIVIR